MSYTPNKPISMANLNTALNFNYNQPITLNDVMVRRLQVATSGIACGTPSPGSSYMSMNSLRNKPGPDPYGTYSSQYCTSGYTLNMVYANGNYGTYVGSSTPNSTTCGYVAIQPGNLVYTGDGNIVLPAWAGPTINIITVGGGGGGGGGSGRTSWSGFFTGGGGGGGGAISVAYNVPVTASRGVSWQIGIGGAGGIHRDGSHSSGSWGGGGGTTTVWVGLDQKCQATGGWGGSVAPATNSRANSGYASIGSSFMTPSQGGAPVTGSTGGGGGAYGFEFRANYGAPLGGGFYRWDITQGVYGNGGAATQGSGVTPGPGSGWGAGGSGGGCNQSDVYRNSNNVLNGHRGTDGIVFIWWGY